MNDKNSTAIYRPLLREAWRLTWQRKTLWIFGIFAAFVSTGGVMDLATNGLQRASMHGSLMRRVAETCFTNYTLLGEYIGQVRAFGALQSTVAIFFVGLIFIGLLFLAVLSQTSLIHGIKSETPEHPNIIRKRAHDHLFRIFTVDLGTKVISSLLIVVTAIPMLWYFAETGRYNVLIGFFQTLILFPGALIISIISMLSVIHLIETECTVREAVQDSWNVFTKHWLATFEYALILFAFSALACLVILGIIVLLSVPYALVYTLSLLTGSFVIFVITNVLYGLFALAVVLACGGCMVTYQYSAWYLFYKQTEHRNPVFAPISKFLRWLRRA